MATDTLMTSEVDLDRPAVDTVRVLAMDTIQKAGCGHPGTAIRGEQCTRGASCTPVS